MKSNNILPDSFTYSTLIKGIKNSKDKNPDNLEKAFNLLDDLISSELQPDEILFNCLIDACVKFNNLPRAEDAYKQMLYSGVVPSPVTFGILIKAYGNSGMLEKAFNIFETCIKKRGVIPNDVTYGCLMDACIKSNNINSLIKVYEQMKKDGVKLNTILYTTLIKGFSRVKRLDKALSI